MEAIINDYISHELVSRPELLPLAHDSPLLGTVFDSLTLLKLVMFLEQTFHVAVTPADIVPENFATIDAICAYVRAQQQAQEGKL
jgi:acyl carrier protein